MVLFRAEIIMINYAQAKLDLLEISVSSQLCNSNVTLNAASIKMFLE